jgi:hypothetical protein
MKKISYKMIISKKDVSYEEKAYLGSKRLFPCLLKKKKNI